MRPGLRHDRTVPDTPPPEHAEQFVIEPASGPQLGDGKWQELQEGGAAGQGLRNPRVQQQVLRPGQDPSATLLARVHVDLYVGEKIGCSLYFVEYAAVGHAIEETARIVECALAHVGRLEVGIGLVRKHGSHQGRLPGLAGTGQHDRRGRAGATFQERPDSAFEGHTRTLAAVRIIVNRNDN